MNTAGVIEHQTVRAIVENVDQARHDIDQAFRLLQGAKERLHAVLGNSSTTSYGHLWSHTLTDYDMIRNATTVDATVARNAWRYVLAQTGITAYMTERRQKELYEQLEKGHFPCLTVENVLSTLQGLQGQLGTLLLEAAKEVFDWLRPTSDWGVGALKTNHKWKIGPKVIVGWTVEANWTHGYHLHDRRTANVRALGNVFSLLDGQGVQQYPHDLTTQLNAALKEAQSGDTVHTPYLDAKPYKNGNMHLHFLRADLVDTLNHLCSDGTLPGAAREQTP